MKSVKFSILLQIFVAIQDLCETKIIAMKHYLALIITCICLMGNTSVFPQKKNVLFLIVDDLNTWLLSNPDRYTGKVIAPNIKDLAESGVNFTQAFTASPKCSPSRAAFLSGVAPWVSGIYENSQDQQASPALQKVTNLIKYFNDNGYYTAGGGKINHGYNLGDAWTEYIDDHHATRDRPYPMTPEGNSLNGWDTYGKEADWGPIDDPNNVNSISEEEMMDTYAAGFAVAQVNKASGNQPFFIVCGLFHPHMPWHAPQKYFDMYPLDSITVPEIIPNDFDDIPEIAHQYGPVGTWQKIQDGGINIWKEAIQGYLASTSYADAQIGRVLDALKANGLEDNTIVVLLSDHGFHLGEKEHWQKSTLWEEATNSLFMFRVPGLTDPGGTCKRTVSFLDLYPTLVDLADLPDPGHFNPAYQRTLTPLLKDPLAIWPHPAISSYNMEMSVRTEKHRYIRYTDGSVELYNRDDDPHEWTNLAVDADYMQRKGWSIINTLEGYLPALEDMSPPYWEKPLQKLTINLNISSSGPDGYLLVSPVDKTGTAGKVLIPEGEAKLTLITEYREKRYVTITPFGYDVKWDGDVIEEDGMARIVMKKEDKSISGTLSYNPKPVKKSRKGK